MGLYSVKPFRIAQRFVGKAKAGFSTYLGKNCRFSDTLLPCFKLRKPIKAGRGRELAGMFCTGWLG